jgi:hypothetical protein
VLEITNLKKAFALGRNYQDYFLVAADDNCKFIDLKSMNKNIDFYWK